MDKVFTIPELSRELKLKETIIRTAIGDASPDMSSGNGRFKFYSVDRVKDVLRERNLPLLIALGYIQPAGQVEAEEVEGE